MCVQYQKVNILYMDEALFYIICTMFKYLSNLLNIKYVHYKLLSLNLLKHGYLMSKNNFFVTSVE